MCNKSALIVDFDGTYIHGNSFRMWVLYVLKKTLLVRMDIFSKVLLATLKRKVIKTLSHVEYKEFIDSLSYPEHLLDGFFRLISNNISQKVYKEVENANKNNLFSSVILSTAAPSCYIEYFFEKGYLPLFSSVKCSKFSENKFVDNYKEEKYFNFCKEYEFSNFVLFTDHEDDLFLAIHAERVYLCNASGTTKETFCSQGINFIEIFDENC